VVVGDKVVFEGTVGYADAATREPVTPTTVFRLASLSKAFATAITGLLVDDGKLDWDTRLIDVLPYFKLKNMQEADQATVSDILGQKIGLPRNTFDNMLEDDIPYQELVRKLDEVDMTCGVGQCYGYQNVAFSMIGDVVLARTGDFFYHLVDKRLFYPLGMTTATYGRAGLESSKNWARPHHASRHGWVPFEPNETYYRVAPAAGVNASLRDMEKWLIAQMGGRPDVLPGTLLDVLHAPGVNTPSELHSSPWRRARLSDAHYALGWRVYRYGGETLIYHAGAVAGYRTMIGFFPDADGVRRPARPAARGLGTDRESAEESHATQESSQGGPQAALNHVRHACLASNVRGCAERIHALKAALSPGLAAESRE